VQTLKNVVSVLLSRQIVLTIEAEATWGSKRSNPQPEASAFDIFTKWHGSLVLIPAINGAVPVGT
jgi:hypothetical protein